MVTTFSFLIHISSVKVAFVFISLYEILRILDPATVLAKGTYKRVIFDVFLIFFYIYVRRPHFWEAKNGSYQWKNLESDRKKKSKKIKQILVTLLCCLKMHTAFTVIMLVFCWKESFTHTGLCLFTSKVC